MIEKGGFILRKKQRVFNSSQGWREIGGMRKYYRSKWEANYARYLDFLRVTGYIKEWHHEPDTFWFESIRRGVRSYLPDFKVVGNDGEVVYHEVKGYMDAKSKTKLKRMAKYHPDIKIKLIDGKVYRHLAKTAGMVVGGWE